MTPNDEEVTAVENLLMPVQEDRSEVTLLEPAITAAEPTVMVQQIMALANQITNPEMFDRLVAWHEREESRQKEAEFDEAMNACQADIEPVARTAENKQTGSFYAKLENVDAAIRPHYLRHGFSVAYNTVEPLVAGNIRVECRVSRKGFSRLYYREAAPDTLGPKGTPVKTGLHGGGSTETFLRRYAVCGAFNVVFRNLDDDGVLGGARAVTAEQVDQLLDSLEGRVYPDGRPVTEGGFISRMASGVDGRPLTHFSQLLAMDYDRVLNTLKLMKLADQTT